MTSSLKTTAGVSEGQILSFQDCKWTVHTQSCLTLCDPMDCSPPGSSVHEISQTRILEWVPISFSRGSSWPRDQTRISGMDRRILDHWTTREALCVKPLKSKEFWSLGPVTQWSKWQVLRLNWDLTPDPTCVYVSVCMCAWPSRCPLLENARFGVKLKRVFPTVMTIF